MKFKKLNSSKLAEINISRWRIDWDYEVSKPQKLVKDFLKPFWKHHIVLEEFVIPGSRLRIDLLNLTTKIAIEVSPRQHFEMNAFFHKTKAGYLSSIKRDVAKEKWIKDSGFKYVELQDDDLLKLSREWFKETHDVVL